MKKRKEQDPGDSKISPAHEQANLDIQADPDLRPTTGPEDDLDEGELAKLEGED